MAFRIILGSILFASALVLPLWVSVIIGVVGLILFPSYYELVAVAFLSDLLFAVPQSRFFSFQFVTTAIVLVVVIGVNMFRKKMLR